MVQYKNLRGNSNVQCFEILPQSIKVKFYNTARIYSYSYSRAGINNVETMKLLAKRGYGLNSYINRVCKYLYDNSFIG